MFRPLETKPIVMGVLALAALFGVNLLHSDPVGNDPAPIVVAAKPEKAPPWQGKIHCTGGMISGNVVSLSLRIGAEGEAKEVLRIELIDFLLNALNGQERWEGEDHLRVRDFAAYCLAEVDDKFQYSVEVGSLPHERDVKIRELLLKLH